MLGVVPEQPLVSLLGHGELTGGDVEGDAVDGVPGSGGLSLPVHLINSPLL